MPDVEPDKDHLYGRYQRQEDWRNNLHRKVAHKSLDIPETDDVNVDNSRHGIGMKELIAIGAMVIGGPLAYAAFTQFMKPESDQKPPVSSGPVVLVHQDRQGTLLRGRKDLIEYMKHRSLETLTWYRVTLP